MKDTLKHKKVAPRVARFVFDEAHCIREMAGFRPDYAVAARIRLHFPDVPIYATTATLRHDQVGPLTRLLGFRPERTRIVHRSNERDNLSFIVRKMEHPIGSYKDLDFLLPTSERHKDFPHGPTLVFANSQSECEAIAHHLRDQLDGEQRKKVIWFHAGMTEAWRLRQIERMKKGELDIIVCTEAAGLVCSLITLLSTMLIYIYLGS